LTAVALPAQDGRCGIVAERGRSLNGTASERLEPRPQVLGVALEKRSDIAVLQIRPDAVRAQQQHIARLERLAAADRHLRNGRIPAQAALHEIAHWVRRDFLFRDLAFAQQQLDMTVVASARVNSAVAYPVDAAVADVSPVGSAFLHEADGNRRARARIDALAAAEPRHVVVRLAQRQMEKTERVEQRVLRLMEGIQQALERGVSRATAVGMASHSVDHDQQRRLVGCRHGDAILVVLAIADQAYFCMLNPQARAPAKKVI
jgi:hypothetical protein